MGSRPVVGPDRHPGRSGPTTGELYSAFFVAEEGTLSSFRGLYEVIAAKGLFCSLYTDRGSHYWHTPDAGGKVDKDNPTQVGRELLSKVGDAGFRRRVRLAFLRP